MRPERAEFERKKKNNVTFTEAQTYTHHSTEVKRVTDYEEEKKKKEEDRTLTRSNQQGKKKKRDFKTKKKAYKI